MALEFIHFSFASVNWCIHSIEQEQEVEVEETRKYQVS